MTYDFPAETRCTCRLPKGEVCGESALSITVTKLTCAGGNARSGERADHDVVTVRIADCELSGPGGGIRLGLLLELTDKNSGT